MNSLTLPTALDFTCKDNSPENSAIFKTQLKSYMILSEACGNGKDKKLTNEKVKLALFISVICGQGIQLIKKLGFTDANVDSIFKRLN